MRRVRIKDNQKPISELYPLNEFTPHVIQELGKRIVHLLAVGYGDVGGDAFSQVFADCFAADALGRPLGIADVIWNGCAWSVKTVKHKRPHNADRIRLISGRNSVNYSAGIADHTKDIQATGRAVLDIYNERIKVARREHDHLRLLIFIRNMEDLEFTMFERPINELVVNDYSWEQNERGNLQGYLGERHVFTWQPHGSQFTMLQEVPRSATRFQIAQRPGMLDIQHVLQVSGFTPDWIQVLPHRAG